MWIKMLKHVVLQAYPVPYPCTLGANMIRAIRRALGGFGFALVVSSSPAAHAQATTTAPPTAPPTAAAAADASGSATQPRNSAESQPTKDQCVAAHKQCQQARQLGRLVEARELARSCTSLVCPGLLISDCARWLNELDERIPSVVFEVRLDGQPNLKADVFADNRRVDEWTRGQALRVDPGEHTFRFVLPPHPEKIETLLLAEGMRYRIVSAEFTTAVAAVPAPSVGQPVPVQPLQPLAPAQPLTHRPVPVVVYPLLGVGALGLIGFGGFALVGQNEQSNLEKICAPGCTDDQMATMRQRYLIADISLGVGAAGLLGAGIVYLARPEEPIGADVGVTVLPGGGVATLTMRNF